MRATRAALVFVVALAALGAGGAPVAFVADLRGIATIEGNGRLAFLAELSPGTRLLLGTNATAAITYASSGAEFTLSGPGQFLVSADKVTAERGADPKQRAVAPLSNTAVVTRASQTATASLRMRGIAPAAAPAALEFPVATRVATLRPELRWRSSPGGQYTVAIQDAAGRELWKGPGNAAGTRPAVPLTPSATYTWTVASTRGPVGMAKFDTLPAEVIRRAEKSRADARTFADRVVHALLLQEIGADQEARDAWGVLARERPDLSGLPALAR